MIVINPRARYVAGLPNLDIYTVSEDWLLAVSLEHHWAALSELLQLKPSQWIDAQGDRMYAAVIYLKTYFNLDMPVQEDDVMDIGTTIESIAKPHSLSRTSVLVDGSERASVTILASFIKRNIRGSNKKFSRIKDLWKSDDLNADAIEALNNEHHDRKSADLLNDYQEKYQISRIQDFNTADFMYFKNFIRIAKTAEWRSLGDGERKLNTTRECYFYGNVEDGDVIVTNVQRDGDAVLTEHLNQDLKRIFLTRSVARTVDIPVR